MNLGLKELKDQKNIWTVLKGLQVGEIVLEHKIGKLHYMYL